MSINKVETAVQKTAEIHAAIESALTRIDENAGRDGYRNAYDKAIHILVALKRAGYEIVRERRKPKNEELLRK